MIRYILISAILLMVITAGCSKDHSDLPTGFIYDPPSVPTDLDVTGGAELASLSWDFPGEELDEISEFRIYYYYEYYGIQELIGTTTETSYVDSFLVGNLQYCYQVSAVDSTGLEGYRTEAECAFVGTSN